MKKSINHNRRRLLRSIASLPLATSGVSLLSAPTQVSAQAAACGPKSLVCLFLAGGADSFNTFVPGNPDAYADYRAARNELAVAEQDLLEVTDIRQGTFGFNRLTASLARLYNENRLAVVANTGPLIKPTSKQDYQNLVSIPQSLFAHNTQQKLWQTGAGFVGGSSAFGWGGAIADHAARCNGNLNIPSAISMAGSNDWQTSRSGNYISLNAAATINRMLGLSNESFWIPGDRLSRLDGAFRNLMQQGMSSNSAMHRELSGAFERANIATDALNLALNTHTLPQMQYNTRNQFALQLHLVARLIAARNDLGMQQQVFFVRMGGWDTHSNQNQRLPSLMSAFNEGIDAFTNTLDDIGMMDTVTAFTASDFGRTLTSNGNGTDHGWGGHNFVFGGAVKGGSVYGDMPSYASSGNPDDASENDNDFAGRIIPKISVTQYGATIARWMGVPDSEMLNLFPDLSNFSVRNIGFLDT